MNTTRHDDDSALLNPDRTYCGTTDDLDTVREHLLCDERHEAEFQAKDGTLSHYTGVAVRLDEVRVVHRHPTDPRGQDVTAPSGATYRLWRRC